MIVQKVIRLSLPGQLEKIRSSIKNLKIIRLIRDPRAIYLSRLKILGWDKDETFKSIEKTCKTYEELIDLKNKVDSLFIIKYENFVSDRTRWITKISKFLGTSLFSELESLPDNLKSHQYNTRLKDSSDPLVKWKTELTENQILKVEEVCLKALVHFDYKLLYE